MDSKCCCCTLGCGSIVVGSFSMIVSLIFLGLAASCSSSMKYDISFKLSGKQGSMYDEDNVFYEKMVGNIMAILAFINVVEAVVSVGLIWGASKQLLNWITVWLGVSATWILLHSVVAISTLFAFDNNPGVVILISVLGGFLLGMSALSMLTVGSYRKLLLQRQLIEDPLLTQVLP